MKAKLRRAALTALAALMLVSCAYEAALAHAHSTDRPIPHRYSATLVCNGLAEDSAAHVRLVRYDVVGDDHVVLVYRCLHAGY